MGKRDKTLQQMKDSVGHYKFLDKDEQQQRYNKIKQSGNMFDELDGDDPAQIEEVSTPAVLESSQCEPEPAIQEVPLEEEKPVELPAPRQA